MCLLTLRGKLCDFFPDENGFKLLNNNSSFVLVLKNIFLNISLSLMK